MHPAPSVILFSTLSGAGFGLLAWLCLGDDEMTGLPAFVYYLVGYTLALGGLMFSAFHLANKKNALKAFRQWRSSWLSREAIMAVVALIIVSIDAVPRIFYFTPLPIIGAIGAICCIVTVFTTAMIYTQLKTVPRWNTMLTPILFVGFAIGGGALAIGYNTIAIFLLIVLAAVQVIYWLSGDSAFEKSNATIEAATGLGTIGKVRLLEPPHSGENYLLNEMAFKIGRKHAFKLRMLTLVFAFILPILILALFSSTSLLVIACVLHLLGVFASRWLFFAEAKHVVSLYYDR